MKGYKAFDKKLSCRGYQFEIGKTYHHEGEIELCSSGFHFCEKLINCYNYYNSDARICEIEATGTIINGDDGKSVTNNIRINRELTTQEINVLRNLGIGCTGIRNTGRWNTGDRNTGDSNTGSFNVGNYNTGDENVGYLNTGNRNTGNRNTGNRNTGGYNTGSCNSGYYNTGHWNTGNYNIGNDNTGDWNKTNGSSGVLCTEESECLIFDKPSGMTLSEWRDTDACDLLEEVSFNTTIWVDESDMSDDEKKKYPDFYVCGGYLKTIESGHQFIYWWKSLNEAERNIIKAIPNFDADKWYTITGIDIDKEY